MSDNVEKQDAIFFFFFDFFFRTVFTGKNDSHFTQKNHSTKQQTVTKKHKIITFK